MKGGGGPPWAATLSLNGAVEIARTILEREPSAHDANVFDGLWATHGDWGFANILLTSDEKLMYERAFSEMETVEFIKRVYGLAQGRTPNPAEIDSLATFFDYGLQSRGKFLREMVGDSLLDDKGAWNRLEDAYEVPQAADMSFTVMGTGRLVHRSDWDRRRVSLVPADIKAFAPAGSSSVRATSTVLPPTDHAVEAPRVAVVSSLYRCDEYLEDFLRNLQAQTVFAASEVCLVAVDPTASERSRLKRFADETSNVQLLFRDDRIGIYEAWNIAVENTSAPYLTNMNADDLRRHDSLALQAEALDSHSWVDVVYQDFYYTMERTLSWDFIEAMGFKSELPHVTLSGMLAGVNGPHNAPMWRRELHEELGLFDESFESAGDFEFWLRCLIAGKQFFKLNDPHVAYFVNPLGLSTRPGGVGVREVIRILDLYADRIGYGEMPSYCRPPVRAQGVLARSERLTLGAIDRALALRF
jgi:hypothetical protein